MSPSPLGEALAALPPLEPSWVAPESRAEPASAAEGEAFLAALDETDRRLFVLVHGCGLDVGTAAYVLRLDPAVAVWRMQSALHAAGHAGGAAALERGVAAALRSGSPAERAERLGARLGAVSDDLADRLAAGLGGARSGIAEENRPGLGIGSFVLILLAIGAFLAYGFVQDVNPLWRGQKALRNEQFDRARRAFEALGANAEGRAWSAITFLAEGRYAEALSLLSDAAAAQYLGLFRPVTAPLERLDDGASPAAMLPRGSVSLVRPRFAWRGEDLVFLSIEGPDGEAGPGLRRQRRVAVEPGEPIQSIEYPADWPALEAGSYVWSVGGRGPDAPRHSARFTVIHREQRLELQRHVLSKLGYDMPGAARTYLRAQFDLRHALYMQAGLEYADLTRQFPDESHPREMLEDVAGALGVDPKAFLR